MLRHKLLIVSIAVVASWVFAATAGAAGKCGKCGGEACGAPTSQPAAKVAEAPAPNPAPAWQSDHEGIWYLLSHRLQITRRVTNTSQGVVTVTESDDPEVAAAIRAHVNAMHARVKEGRGIHLRDPLFRALFAKASSIRMQIEPTEKGMQVIETSDDAYVARLIQLHAAVVSKFINFGHDEVRRNHEVPPDRP